MVNVYKGQHIRVFYDGAVIAKSVSCNYQIQNSGEDLTTKNDASLASKETVTQSSWQVQVSALDETNIIALLTAWKNLTRVEIKWDGTTGTDNDTAAGQSFAREGIAYIGDLTIRMNDREVVATDVTFVGDGELSTVTI